MFDTEDDCPPPRMAKAGYIHQAAPPSEEAQFCIICGGMLTNGRGKLEAGPVYHDPRGIMTSIIPEDAEECNPMLNAEL